MKPIIIDANAFLRFLLNDIPTQKEEFKRLTESTKKSGKILIVPQIVIFEINFILDKYYKTPKEDIIEKIESLLSASYFKVQNKDIFKNAISIYKKENISLEDSFILCYARELGGELFTFDKKLKKLS
jgi:uncharacterized protein